MRKWMGRHIMNSAITEMDMPAWLSRQTAETMATEPLPLEEILTDSLYYAGAGYDGAPVEHLLGNVHSFVYTDYLARKTEVLSQLHSRRDGFRGYRIVGLRELELDAVFPQGIYGPAELDYRLWINEHDSPGRFMRNAPKPFALWVVLESDGADDLFVEPFRFSLLHVCFESVAAYAGLYLRNGIVPKIIYLINHGYGANWTDFEDPEKVYTRTVASHPRGLPEYLVARRNRETCDCDTLEEARNHWESLYPGTPLAAVGHEREFLIWRSTKRAVRKRLQFQI